MLVSIKEAAVRADLSFVALALLVYAVSVPLVALRWRTVLRGVAGGDPPLGPLILATLASSFVNNVTPAARLGGEACRVVALVRLRLAPVSKAVAAAAYERLTEAPAVALIAALTVFAIGRRPLGHFSQPTTPSAPVMVFTLVMLVVSAMALLLMNRALARAWSRLRSLASIAVAPSALAMSAAMSAAIWALDVLRLRVVSAAFQAPIGLPEAATLTAITIVAGWVPTVGGLGAIEGGLFAGLVAFGVPPADAVAITAVERGISYGIGTAAGFCALWWLGGRSLWNAVRVGVPVSEGAAT